MTDHMRFDLDVEKQTPRILINVQNPNDSRLIVENLPDRFEVIYSGIPRESTDANFDLCITDYPTYLVEHNRLQREKEREAPVYLPILMFTRRDESLRDDSSVWNTVDDIIRIPVPVKILNARVESLLQTRQYSLELQASRQKLKAEKEKFRLLAENSTDKVARFNADGEYIYVSPASLRVTGYRPDELVGRSAFDFIHPDDLHAFERSMEKTGASQDISTFAYRFKMKKGSYKWVESTSRALRWPGSDEVKEFQLSTRDISKRINYQQQLETEKTFSDSVIDSLPGLFFMIDEYYALHRWNTNLEWVSGYNTAELGRMNFYELFGEKEHARLNNSLERAFEQGEMSVELNIRNKKGKEFPVIMSGERLTYGHKTYIVGSCTDISDRVAAEKELEAEKLFEENIINSLPGIFFFYNRELQNLKVNQKFFDELGYTPEQLKATHPINFFEESERKEVRKRVQKVFREGESSGIRRVKKADGTTAHYFFNTRRFDQHGSSYIIGTGIDVTSRMEMEKRLERSLDEKKVLLAEIHHRVKNNLAIITGLLELQRYTSTDERVEAILRDSQARIHSMALVHEQLYKFDDFSQIQVDKYLRRLLKSVSDAMEAHDKDIRVDIEADPVKMTITQAVPCGLLLSEILTNAYKHAFSGKAEGRIDIELKETGGELEISVCDDGPGLPDDFDINSTQSLGMSLIQTLSQQLDAKLNVESDEGSCFLISFELE